MPVSVHEVTMAAPDIVCVEVRDPPITKGPLVEIDTPETGSYSTAIERTNPNSGNTEWCYPKGANKDHLKFHDIRATEYLDRDAADDETGYGTIGGLTVSAVYRKSIPYTTGTCRNAAETSDARCVSMTHFLYLKLSGNLAEGSHTIDFPTDTGLSDAAFTFNDQSTRCSSFRVNQVGHRPGDANKLGYLSVWIPGAPNEGAVQFSATKFYVIDENNKIHFIGDIALRTGPTDVEASSGFADDDATLHRWLNGLVRYRSTNTAPLKITAITKASSGVVTYSGSAFIPANDDIYCLTGIGGMTGLEGRFVKVSSVDTDAKTFAIDVNTTSFGTYAADTYLTAHDSLITKTHLASRAGTYVYGLDYSAWVGQPGLYRLWIPGHGVSDQFRIDEAVWYKVAHNAAKGVYHHRNGMALTAFDYDRPVAYRDGVNGVEIYDSTLPGVFSSEDNLVGSNISSVSGASAPWITANRRTGWYGAHHDAGDWDSFIYSHVTAFYYLLTLGYELLPEGTRSTDFGIPKSTATLDATTYAGTDDLPDAVHEAIYHLDAYRRLQREDGAVGSGLGYPGGSGGVGETGTGPSWVSVGIAYIYAPDHPSNFAYAIGAGKLAIIFAAEGLTTLAALWLASAEAAWDWAEAIYQNASGERDAYYITELDIKTKAGWDDTEYATYMSSANTAVALHSRRAAAGVLFRATGESTYGDIVAALAGQAQQSWVGIAAWEYINAAAADPTTATTFSNSFKTGFDTVVFGYSAGDIGYRNQGYAGNRGMSTGPAEYFACIVSYVLDEDSAKLGTLQAGRGVVLGANQYGSSYTVGLGSRTFTETLHEDSRRAGLDHAPTGITHYGWDFPGILLRVNNFTTDSPLNYVVELPTGDFETDFGTARLYEPHRQSVPFCEHTVESSLIIFHMEYTFHQTIVPMWIVAMWLHAHDSNTQAAYTTGKTRLYSRWGSA